MGKSAITTNHQTKFTTSQCPSRNWIVNDKILKGRDRRAPQEFLGMARSADRTRSIQFRDSSEVSMPSDLFARET